MLMLKPVALFATTIAALHCIAAERALTVELHDAEIRVISSVANTRQLMLVLNEAVAIDLPADIKEILVGDLQTVRVAVRTVRRVLLVGAFVGRTNIVFRDGKDRQILALDVSVVPQMSRPELDVPQQLSFVHSRLSFRSFQRSKRRWSI
jgi:Flp pilus assembly secretin CpaC